MDPIRLGPFLGANRALSPRLLPVGVGTQTLNHWPDRGDLRGWRVPLNVATAPLASKTITILGREKPSDTIYWLVWADVVHAVRSFNADDTTKRTYYSGNGAPKVTDNLIGLAGAPFPTSYRDLGIPKPSTAPTITQTAAGAGADEDRYYAYAYLSDWDEIGMPAFSARVVCQPGAQFSITTLAAPPTGVGNNRGINRIRIWRTVASNVGDFFFVRDVVLPATSTTDNNITVGADRMPSATWAMPPVGLKNLIALWNGIMAGIDGKSVRYCEQHRPYAWPTAYETLCIETPVALGTYESNLIIATTGRPRRVTGGSPEAMDDRPIEFNAACVSEPSMVSLGHGVCWATSDGLAYVGTNGPPRLLTEECMLLDDWQALNPSTIIGAQYGGRYFGFYNASGLKGFMVDPMAPGTISFFDVGAAAVHFDELEEQLYLLNGVNIQKWNAGATSMVPTFTSKVFRLPMPSNPAVAEVIADTYPVTFKLWAGVYSSATGWPAGSLRITKTVANRNEFFLPSGYLADDVQIEVSGGPISGVAVTDSVAALAQT